MAQIFHRSTNTIARVSIYGAAILVMIAGYALKAINMSPYFTEVNNERPQPVPFSHKHHVGELGLDCRYCHTTMETSANAGFPATEVCMTCHSQLWTNADVLAPVRASFATGKALEWNRVSAVPGYVFFNHSIHVNRGVPCEE